MAERSAEASPSESCSSPQEERSGNNWWDSWISSAKNKSAEVYTMVKKDLDEIGTAVKSEASHVFNSTSNVVSKTFKLDVPESPANVMKKSFSTFIGQVSTVLNPEPDDEDDTEVILSSGDTTMLSTYKKELEKIQSVDATFLVPPPEPEFSAWLASVAGEPAAAAAAARRLRASPALAARYHKLVPHALSPRDFWERCVLLSAATLASVAASVAGEPAAAAAAARRLRASPALAARYHKLVPHALSPRDFWERCVLLSAATLASVAASVAGEPAAAAAAARRLRASPALAARYHKLVPHALSPRDFWERCVLLSAATLASVAASVAGEPAAAAAAARRLRASPALAARYHKLVPHALSPRDFWERCVLLSAATLASVAASVAGEPAAAAAAARRLRASPALAARYHKLVPHALSPRDFWERCVLLSAATLASVAASVAGEPAAAAAAARRLRASPALAARYHKLVPHALSPRDFWERCVLLSAATLASVAASVAGEPAAAAAAARRLRASPALAARYHKLVPHALSPRDFWERCVLLSAATLASVAASVAGEPAAAAAAARRLRASPALAARYHKLVPHALSPRDFWERCVLLSAATLASVAGEPAAAAAAARRLRASPALAARYHKLVPHALSPRDFWERCVLLSAATLASVAASVAGEPAAAAAAARRLRASPALAARYHKLVPHALSPRDFWERCVLLSAATLASVAASVAGEPAAAAAAARRLRASPALAARYHKLVPHALSPRDFWERYLFRVALLQDRLAAAARRQPAPDTHDPVLAHLPLDDDTAAHTTPITQSPEKVISSADISDPEQYTSSEDITPADTAVAWEDEDFAADVELTEEQQILLLEEYEKEIASKKQQQPKTRDVANNNTKTTPTNTDNTNTKTKAAQTRDKMNNKADKKKPTKEVTDNKNKSPKKATDNKNKSPKKGPKTDVCGNDLVEDYFGEKEVKDDASANSDESWEKEFEIDDVVQKA